MQPQCDHFNELHRLLVDPSPMNAQHSYGAPTNGAPFPQPGTSNLISLGNNQANAVQISQRLQGRPPLRPGTAKPFPSQPQANSSYPLFQQLVPRNTNWHGLLRPLPAQQTKPTINLPPTTTVERKSKRGKPSARRSLQAMFDAAAEDESSYDSATSSRPDTESNSELDFGISSQNSGDSCYTARSNPIITRTPLSTSGVLPLFKALSSSDVKTPATPEVTESLAAVAHAQGGSVMPLQHLLMSEKGENLTALEVKAILYKVTSDLAALHSSNIVHRHVSLDSVQLACINGVATARLPLHPLSLKVGNSGIHWGPKEQGTEAFTAPESVHCPAERSSYTSAADVWALGVLSFGLLAGGHLPFGSTGLGCDSLAREMPGANEGVDKFQTWLENIIKCKIEVVNQLSLAQQSAVNRQNAPMTRSSQQQQKEHQREMKVIGFDNEATELILSMLRVDPAQRPSARRLLNHPWLAEVAHRLPVLVRPQQQQQQFDSCCDTETVEGFLGGGASQSSPATQYPNKIPNGGSRFTKSRLHRDGSVTGPFNFREPSPSPRHQEAALAAQQQQQLGSSDMSSAGGNNNTSSYSVIGHVSRLTDVMINGEMVTVSALHAVFQVPGRGAMMSAEPVGYAPAPAVGSAQSNDMVNSQGGGLVHMKGASSQKPSQHGGSTAAPYSLLTRLMKKQQLQNK